MSLNNVGQNVANAFAVVRETHRQVDKLMIKIDEVAATTKYTNLTEGYFLRFNSDSERWGWMYGSLIKVFSQKEQPLVHYSLHIHLDDSATPSVIVALNVHQGEAPRTYSKGQGWMFMHRNVASFGFEPQYDEENKVHRTKPADDAIAKKHLGLQTYIYRTIPLLELNNSNIKDKLFGEFDRLEQVLNQNIG